MKLIYPILNTIALIFALIMNYLANTGAFNGKTVGEVSNNYDTLVTPAGYAFSIWGLIYLGLIVFIGYQWYHQIKERDYQYGKGSLWLALANVLNGLWVYVWLNEYTGISVLVMLSILVCLILLALSLDLEIWDAPLRIIAFVWWPIVIYLGWIVLATVANISTYLVKIDFQLLVNPETWAIIIIAIATIIYIFLVQTRNMREAAAVGIWGIAAIGVKQWEAQPAVAFCAFGCCFLLFIVISIHAYKHRDTLPLMPSKTS